MLAHQRSAPYEVVSHKVQPGHAEFRFRLREPVCSELLTTIGDVLHNLRSCLDSVAFELARRHIAGSMTEEQERAAPPPAAQLGLAVGHGDDLDALVSGVSQPGRDRDRARRQRQRCRLRPWLSRPAGPSSSSTSTR